MEQRASAVGCQQPRASRLLQAGNEPQKGIHRARRWRQEATPPERRARCCLRQGCVNENLVLNNRCAPPILLSGRGGCQTVMPASLPAARPTPADSSPESRSNIRRCCLWWTANHQGAEGGSGGGGGGVCAQASRAEGVDGAGSREKRCVATRVGGRCCLGCCFCY